jgi:hypothetical protein
VPAERPSAGDPIPQGYKTIEVRVSALRRLFHSIDPSPFHERDLDPQAEEFVVEWAKDLPRDAPLALVVHLDRCPGHENEAILLREAIHEYFGRRAAGTRRSLRELFRRGRISLAIGLAFLAMSIALGGRLVSGLPDSHLAQVLRESLLIGGWVAMWRPLEIFLYDWWPIREDARLFDRLRVMLVQIVYGTDTPSGSGSSDWPVEPAADGRRKVLS